MRMRTVAFVGGPLDGDMRTIEVPYDDVLIRYFAAHATLPPVCPDDLVKDMPILDRPAGISIEHHYRVNGMRAVYVGVNPP
jgi:hypothetical protein